MRLELKPTLLGAALFLLLLTAASWPWSAREIAFSRALSAIGNLCFEVVPVAPGTEIELVPLLAARERSATENVDSDTQLVLRLAGGEARLGISLRRDAYLPLSIFVAALLVLPLERRRKLASLGLGVPLVLGVAIASVASLAVFVSSQAPGSSVPSWQARLAEFIFDCWLTPPGNRVIAPLLLALGFALGGGQVPGWFRATRARAAATG